MMSNHSSSYLYDRIFRGLPGDFVQEALDLFAIQYHGNHFYRRFANYFSREPDRIRHLEEIPFLPVSFFKTETIQSGNFDPEIIFESSGTTGMQTARHAVRNISLYRESFVKGFEFFYGDPKNYCVLGLLPAYLERSGSSLVFMVDELIRLSGHPESGFYLYDFENLQRVLMNLNTSGKPVLLIGVSFALLDFAETCPTQLHNTIVMETGGMKGRREELTRTELHDILKSKLGISTVHSEYGMTELLSQAYSSGDGIYRPVPWLKVLVRDEDDPLHVRNSGEGLLNVIDLANRDSCAFIATDDVVRLYEDGSFEILGRRDNSDMRGCSLLVV